MSNDIKRIGPQPPAHLPSTATIAPLLPGALTHADNDRQLIALWLRRPNLSADTRRAGEKEAERFLMWCFTLNIGLRDVRYEHLIAYSEFLAEPQPAEQWVSTAEYPRTDPRWRPFCGHLQLRSQLQALIRFSQKGGPANRKKKIFIDYLRNGKGATIACAWSARARPGLGI